MAANGENGWSPDVEMESDGASSVDEAEDPIVKEVDVYMNRVEGGQFYVLQYPLRPVYRPYGDQGQLASADIRQEQGTLRLNYRLNANSENFDESKKMDDLEKEEQEGETEIDHQAHVLVSTSVMDSNCAYCLGLMRGGRLYLTPVNQVVQFRPDFSHVDKETEAAQRRASQHVAATAAGASASSRDEGDAASGTRGKKKKEESAEKNEDDEKEKDRTAEASAAVRGLSNMKEMAEGRNRIPQSKIRGILEAEPWTPVESLYDSESPESFEIVDLVSSFLVEQQVEEDGEKKDADAAALAMLGVDGSPQTAEKKTTSVKTRVTHGKRVPAVKFFGHVEPYLNLLVGGSAAASSNSLENSSSGALSFLSLSKLPIDQQILQILKHRQVITFGSIVSLVTRKLPETELIKLIKGFGILVFGNWVCRSHFVYDGYEALCRDLLLIMLQLKSKSTQRELFSNQTKLPMAVVSEMLQQVAEFKGTSWQFKLPPDNDFLKAYPDEHKEAETWWRNRVQSVKEEIKAHLEKQAAIAAAKNKSADKGSKGSAAAAPAVSNVDSSKLSRIVGEVLRREGGMSIEKLHSAVGKFTETASGSPLGDFTVTDLMTVLPGSAVDIHGLWVLKKIGDSRVDGHREVLIALFRRQPGALTKDDIRKEFRMHLKKDSELPDMLFRSLIREFAVNRQGRWVFKGEKQEESGAAASKV